ncbi:MFS general substrate transporter [Phanerochaete sordida]|uniref:MFS general substrate transporter n=1 Tax=Phanerochaete sordida TaxID=48140 RepID=A0A9P3G659_9APHY|nr:MFS general substrate transporter [Phanerochaete sordida]
MAQVFGRRPCMLLALALFALGSALCGCAQSMRWLIAARTLQGAGGGSILAITAIVISDLVPLAERAVYNAFIGMTWAVAAGMGPIVGGALAEHGQWRWLFYLNLPLTGVAMVLVVLFLNVKTPRGSFTAKMRRMDWIGNALVISSSSALVIALTWGGVQHPWGSAQILAPLVLGLVGLGAFVVYEALVAKEPLVPIALLANRTSFSGYVQTFVSPLLTFSVLYFAPAFYQASWGASPIRSGVWLFGLVLAVGPVLLCSGASIARTKTYRVQLWLGWAAYVAGFGVMSTLTERYAIARATGGLLLLGFGSGIVYSASYFPVLAPLPVSANAPALAFFQFCRSFASVWGVTIGTAVLQTQLAQRLPRDFVDALPGGVSLAYAVIPAIAGLPEPAHTQVRVAFAQSIRVLWLVMIGVAAFGALGALLMRGLPLHTQVDERWGMEEKARRDEEAEEKVKERQLEQPEPTL